MNGAIPEKVEQSGHVGLEVIRVQGEKDLLEICVSLRLVLAAKTPDGNSMVRVRSPRLPLAAARDVHARIDAGGLGGKIVLLPWPVS